MPDAIVKPAINSPPQLAINYLLPLLIIWQAALIAVLHVETTGGEPAGNLLHRKITALSNRIPAATTENMIAIGE
jgi:hypothetical protein